MNNTETSAIIRKQIAIRNYLCNTKHEEVISEITDGLSAQQKYIPSKFFYDVIGSKLFEDITSLPEYYPTRTEKALLKEIASQISKTLRNIDIVELGSGDCSKISILLDAIPFEKMATVRYIPVDVSHAAISKSAEILVKRFPGITIHGLIADFLKHLSAIPNNTNRLFCFFGSTLGNLTRKQSIQFLMDLKVVMKPGDQLLIGLDMVKDIKVLENAYNDNQGVTAAFNKNILSSVNQYIKTAFSPDWFEHIAYYNQPKARIEMHLRALEDLDVKCMYLPDNIRITVIAMLPLMVAVQEACARIGAVTGHGLSTVIKTNYSKMVLYAAVLLVVVANTINIGADIGALAAAAQLLVRVNFTILTLGFTALILVLEIFTFYRVYSRILIWLALTLLAYPLTLFIISKSWQTIIAATFLPHVELNFEFFFIITGVLGTTISPYMFFWQASQEVEEEKELHLTSRYGKPKIRSTIYQKYAVLII